MPQSPPPLAATSLGKPTLNSLACYITIRRSRALHPTTEACAFFSSAQTFFRAIKQVPINLKAFKLYKVCIFWDHNGIKLEMINRSLENLQIYGKVNNTLLHDTWFIGEIKGKLGYF